MMHWSQKKSNTLLSLEFTEKNADLPVPARVNDPETGVHEI
jgi:hypothetical protein